jgi:predicted RNase H-like nuclease
VKPAGGCSPERRSSIETAQKAPAVFIGVDLGWYGKPTGLASLALEGSKLRLQNLTRIQPVDEILAWIQSEIGAGGGIAAVDAPIVIPNPSGIRAAERDLNRDFRRFHAGCHAANLGRPFAQNVIAFSRRLEELGFAHGAAIQPRQVGRYQIEVHPHAASIRLFGLDRIVKYKRGARDEKASELRRLSRLMTTNLPTREPSLSVKLPSVARAGNTKPVEDQIDAVLCAYIGAHWWYWGTERNAVYGTEEEGYIVVPSPPP